MGVEIERKFLVNKIVWEKSDKGKSEYYRQGYISAEPGKTIRVRVTDSNGFLTIKGPANSATRAEYEYEIPKTEAMELLNLFAEKVIEKIRHKVLYKGKLWEVDVFMGDNEGLIVAEIELTHEQEEFDKPDWAGNEVTDDRRYANSSLSLHPYKIWKS